MKIQVVLNSDKSFERKAAYIFETFLRSVGTKGEFSSNKKIEDADLVLYYGGGGQEDAGQVKKIIIHGSPDAWNMFSNSRPYQTSFAKKFRYDEEESVALFYNEAFLNKGKIVERQENNSIRINIDLIASAFFFLSGWQEMTSQEYDLHNRFPAKASLQYQLCMLHQPIVNQYFWILEKEIQHLLREDTLKEPNYHGKPFAVCMTHDIDYVRKWTLGIMYRELVSYFLLNHKKIKFPERFARLQTYAKALLAGNDPYQFSIEKILENEKNHNVHASFFLKTGGKSKYDVSYSVRSPYVRRLVQRLESNGHEIGLHPSYHAHLDLVMMEKEKRRLHRMVSKRVDGVRQHFLRFKIPETWRLQEQNKFFYDTTMGFSQYEGFRMGFCHPFQPYDIEKDEKIDLWEVPLLAMDATFQSYRQISPEESFEIIKQLLLTVKKYHGVAMLLFHNTCYDDLDFSGWGEVFEQSLGFALEQEAFVGSGREILECYTQRKD